MYYWDDSKCLDQIKCISKFSSHTQALCLLPKVSAAGLILPSNERTQSRRPVVEKQFEAGYLFSEFANVDRICHGYLS